MVSSYGRVRIKGIGLKERLTATWADAAEGEASNCTKVSSEKGRIGSLLTGGRNDRLIGDCRAALCAAEHCKRLMKVKVPSEEQTFGFVGFILREHVKRQWMVTVDGIRNETRVG